MIGLGAWSFSVEVSENGYTRLLRVDSVVHLVLHVSLAMMIVGGITFLMSFAGCLGALRENICLLKLVSLNVLYEGRSSRRAALSDKLTEILFYSIPLCFCSYSSER